MRIWTSESYSALFPTLPRVLSTATGSYGRPLISLTTVPVSNAATRRRFSRATCRRACDYDFSVKSGDKSPHSKLGALARP